MSEVSRVEPCRADAKLDYQKSFKMLIESSKILVSGTGLEVRGQRQDMAMCGKQRRLRKQKG